MKKGFTLIEVMVVLFIMALLSSVLAALMFSGRRSWASADTQISLQQDLRKAMAQITGELRDSAENQVSCPADGSACDSFSFNVSQGVDNVTGLIDWSNPVNFTLISGQILRTDGASARVLANNITNMTFVRYSSSSRIVRISLETARETTYGQMLSASLDSAVQLRN